MEEERVKTALSLLDSALNEYVRTSEDIAGEARRGIRQEGRGLRVLVEVEVGHIEGRLIRIIGEIGHDAEYHVLVAYYHASPALFAFLAAIVEAISLALAVIQILNDLIVAITGHNIVYYIDKIIPGFQAWWNDLLNKISNLSSQLGWGVDGFNHLLNAINVFSDVRESLGGKSRSSAFTAKMEKLEGVTNRAKWYLDKFENNPGQALFETLEDMCGGDFAFIAEKFSRLTREIGDITEKAVTALTGVRDIAGELAAMQEDMPAFIAEHIPPGIWEGLDRVENTIDDGIMPVLTDIQDRVAEVDALLESYRAKAEALAEDLNRPGDIHGRG